MTNTYLWKTASLPQKKQKNPPPDSRGLLTYSLHTTRLQKAHTKKKLKKKKKVQFTKLCVITDHIFPPFSRARTTVYIWGQRQQNNKTRERNASDHVKKKKKHDRNKHNHQQQQVAKKEKRKRNYQYLLSVYAALFTQHQAIRTNTCDMIILFALYQPHHSFPHVHLG